MNALPAADFASVVIGAVQAGLGDRATVSDVVLDRKRMVVVDITGAFRRSLSVDTAAVALQVYAPDSIEAAQLCADALAELEDAQGYEHRSGAIIYTVTPTSLPVPFADPDAREPRYQATADVGITPPDQ